MRQVSKPAVRVIGPQQKTLSRRILDNWQLYLLLLIPVVLTIVYKYLPMYGIQIAFRDFKASRGYMGSEWVGLYWFNRFFSYLFAVLKFLKYSFVSRATMPLNASRAIRLGIAIRPLNMSAIFQTACIVMYGPIKTASI